MDKYIEFINELSVRIEGGWSPADTIPYNEDLLRHTLELSLRVKSNEEFSNPWGLSPTKLEQDQAFIRYLEELNEPISVDELAEWSNDIDLFMEGLTNPDKLETLWEQSKVKKAMG